MTLNEYCEFVSNPQTEAKARVLVVPQGDIWAMLRLFCQERGYVELRLSDFVVESAWLPMPEEVFGLIRDAMMAQAKSGNASVLLGIPGYLSLLTDENKRAAIVALRKCLDDPSGQEAVWLLRNDDCTGAILRDIFANPRYRQGKQLIEIDTEQATPSFEVERAEVTLVGDDLAFLIPEECDTFHKYLRYTEDYPSDRSLRRIVVTSEGRELAGISAEVRQVVCLRDFAREFYDVIDDRLSDDALRWMCRHGKDGSGKTLSETLKALFFSDGEITKFILSVFDKTNNIEREALLWLAKTIAPKNSYLEKVVIQENIVVDKFRSAYISSARQWLDSDNSYAAERKHAIYYADVRNFTADIKQFIVHCYGESTDRVAPWLNCGTYAERSELLRRCAADRFVSNSVKSVYQQVSAYLNNDHIFEDEALKDYFDDYRKLKITGRLTSEFYDKAKKSTLPGSLQFRDEIVQIYTSDSGCALLVVDAMGAEWLPMLVTQAKQRNIGVDSIAVAQANLPTSTKFNKIFWPDTKRRLPDSKRFDNIAHNGAELYEARSAEENLAAALDVIDGEVLPRVEEGLASFERVLVTADHGSSRLAVLAWQSEPKLAQTLACEAGVEILDWRYCARAAQSKCSAEMEETLDGKYFVVRGYNRLLKKGGGQSFELHGGATLEERLVPIVIFSKKGQFVPRAKISDQRAQLIEKDGFDL